MSPNFRAQPKTKQIFPKELSAEEATDHSETLILLSLSFRGAKPITHHTRFYLECETA